VSRSHRPNARERGKFIDRKIILTLAKGKKGSDVHSILRVYDLIVLEKSQD